MWLEPWKGSIEQGVLVETPNWNVGDFTVPIGLVLSNACDIANDKCGYLILLGLAEASFVLTSSKEYLSLSPEKSSKKTKKAIKDYFQKFIHNKDIRRYYFIGALDEIGIPDLVVDFQLLNSVPYDPNKEKLGLVPVARLKSPFKEQLIVHFSAYTSRIPSDRVVSEAESTIISRLTGSDMWLEE